MKIGIDLDTVLIDLTQLYRDAFVFEGYTKFWYPETWEMDNYDALISAHVKAMFKQQYYMATLPYTERRDDLNELFNDLRKNGHSLYIITSRPETHGYIINQQIKIDFPDIFCRILHTDNKVNAMLNNGIDLLVDDNPETIEAVNNAGMVGVLYSNYTTPYNYDYKYKKGFGLKSIESILKLREVL